MAHYFSEIKSSPNQLFNYTKREIDHLRIYAEHKMKKGDYSEARKALASAICFNNQLLNRCALKAPLRQQMMEEGIKDMKAFKDVDTKFQAKRVSEEKKKLRSNQSRPPIVWQLPSESPSELVADGFNKFKHLITYPSHAANHSQLWDAIIGHAETKDFIESCIKYPLMYPTIHEGERLTKGILLYGPPGTGKTMLAKSIAAKIGLPFLELKCTEMMCKWLGETEQNIRCIFALAQYITPCVVFLDEVDSIAGQRDGAGDAPESRRSVMNQLLTSMEESNGVFVVAATNFPWQIDSAFGRRLTRKIYIPLPSKEERIKCIKSRLERVGHNLLDIDIRALNEKFEFFSNDDILKWMDAVITRKKAKKMEKCKFFAQTSSGVWYPTTSFNPGAIEKKFIDFVHNGEKCELTNFTLMDFETDFPTATADAEIVKKYEEYAANIRKSKN